MQPVYTINTLEHNYRLWCAATIHIHDPSTHFIAILLYLLKVMHMIDIIIIIPKAIMK